MLLIFVVFFHKTLTTSIYTSLQPLSLRGACPMWTSRRTNGEGSYHGSSKAGAADVRRFVRKRLGGGGPGACGPAAPARGGRRRRSAFDPASGRRGWGTAGSRRPCRGEAGGSGPRRRRALACGRVVAVRYRLAARSRSPGR